MWVVGEKECIGPAQLALKRSGWIRFLSLDRNVGGLLKWGTHCALFARLASVEHASYILL